MMIIGYSRVSTSGQDHALQIDALEKSELRTHLYRNGFGLKDRQDRTSKGTGLPTARRCSGCPFTIATRQEPAQPNRNHR